MRKQLSCLVQDYEIGDPELGGWRPLPLDLFNKTSDVSRSSNIVNIREALKLTADELQQKDLRNAIEYIARAVSDRNSDYNKGGSLCS